ncbi:MAG: lasso peptide isopeptide bond-forming cyclase [Pleurocapsa sp.]
MSGIFGIYYRDGRTVERQHLEQMSDLLAHRGSDRREILNYESVGFGHCQLWTTPESLAEKLPNFDASGNLMITADLRLDNRAELREILGFDGKECITDSQLVLAAYQQWGTDCQNQLLGDFAFALWDKRSQRLFCARDHYGVKQLYYYCSDRVFIFATEIKALFCLPEVPRRLNEVKVADYLLTLFEDRGITFYEGILRLPPAHYLTVNPNRVEAQQYWSFQPEENIVLGSNIEYAEAFAELFTEAVRCRMRSNFRVGTLLSGGLDSSSITCVAKNLLNREQQKVLPTFSAIFDRITECDERSYIQTVATEQDIEPHYIQGDEVGVLTDWQRTIWHQDEAYYAPNIFLHCELYRKAQQQNVRVLLDGFDGDTTISHGIAYLAELARTGNLLYLILELQGLSRNFGRSPWQLLWRHGLQPILPSKLLRLSKKLSSLNQTPTAIRLQLQQDFVRRIDLKERIKTLQRGRSQLPKTSREAHYRRLTAGVMPFALEVADKAAASFGIEPRYPFFDKRLMEFCLALPPEQKMYRGWTRIIMRRAMNGILPRKIQWRGGKSNLGANFNYAVQLGKEELDRVVREDLEYIADYIDINLLRSHYRKFSDGQDMTHQDFLTIWKSLSLALWLKDANLCN